MTIHETGLQGMFSKLIQELLDHPNPEARALVVVPRWGFMRLLWGEAYAVLDLPGCGGWFISEGRRELSVAFRPGEGVTSPCRELVFMQVDNDEWRPCIPRRVDMMAMAVIHWDHFESATLADLRSEVRPLAGAGKVFFGANLYDARWGDLGVNGLIRERVVEGA